jgi:DNA-binding transcriptional MerR regulator
MAQTQDVRDLSYLSTGQVAEILGITKKTLKNWLKAQLIPEPDRNPMNRYRRWTLQDVEAVRRIVTERNSLR